MNTYGLQVVPIPTNRPIVRADEADLIYKTEVAKFDAVVEDLAERYEKGQPVLVGTISVEKSEYLSKQLQMRGIPHEVLNAKQHTREAGIVAQAGRLRQRHRRHQHGRPRRRHHPRRQPRGPRPPGGPARGLLARHALEEWNLPSSLAEMGEEYGDQRAKAQARYAELIEQFTDECRVRGRQGARARRPVRARHRAPREPAHRQPAPRPFRPPGRSRRQPLLPQPRRRADAVVRHRRDAVGDGQGPARRRADRGPHGHARPSSGPRTPSSSATPRSARTCSSTTR